MSSVKQHAHCELFLKMFQEAAALGRPVYTADLAAISRNHTARISQLRKLGHVIVCKDVPEGDPRYGEGATFYWYRGTTDEASRFQQRVSEVTKLYDQIIRLDFAQQVALVKAVVLFHPGRTAAFSLAA